MWKSVKGVFNFVGHTTSVLLGTLSLVFLVSQVIGCSIRNASLIRMHGCTLTGFISMIPGGQLMIWARERMSWRSDLERLLSLSNAELVQLGERIREAYVEQNLEPLPQNLFPKTSTPTLWSMRVWKGTGVGRLFRAEVHLIALT